VSLTTSFVRSLTGRFPKQSDATHTVGSPHGSSARLGMTSACSLNRSSIAGPEGYRPNGLLRSWRDLHVAGYSAEPA
jgi:hypothetical protein